MESLHIDQTSNQHTDLLPSEVRTKNGHVFDPNMDIWSFDDISNTNNINFNELYISTDKLYGLKRTFILYIESYSLRHTVNMFNRLKHLLNYLYELTKNDIDEITSIDLINYRSTLDKQHEWYLGALSGFLKQWYKMGFSGLSSKAYGYLNEIKLKGNQKGTAVLTMCPYDGPFTDLELESIQSSLNKKYANNDISEADYLLIWLMMIYGSRPIQFALLKASDLQAFKKQDGSMEYIICIPRAKNRKKARSEFKERLVPPEIGQVLFAYRNKVKENFNGFLDDTEQAPLFPSFRERRSGELALHCSSSDISSKIQKVISGFNVISERTEEKLHITSTRFRRTIGTRAAIEGHGELIIAEILDHTDTQNTGVYVQAMPEIIERIDKAVATYMAPIAQAFAGVLLADKSTAIRFDDPTSDIIDPRVDSECKPMGKCGSYGFCGLLAPIACYTCSSFQAWVDGPHEKLLESLLEERERLLKTTDHRIASINDKTIFSVAHIVQECKKYKEQEQQELMT
jgi:hypothetical protein